VKYRKKPVVIEAVKLENTILSILGAVRFVYGESDDTDMSGPGAFTTVQKVREDDGIRIFTLEGPLMARIGDYIIKDVEGEFYPCRESVFLETYEEVTE
jgi:hypothetical protein